jgi:ABC-type oligopeptide transport system ATPase subunit
MPFLSAHNLKRTFASRRRGSEPVIAVDNVSLSVDQGQTLGLVGESGSGKSTLGRLISRLIEPDEGSVVLDGVDLTRLKGHKLRLARSEFQVVFQEPFASLNPRMAVGQIVEEPLLATGLERSRSKRRDRVAAILQEVGLPSEFLDRRPADLSGGQQQRVGIARALVSEPKLVILDEPTSSLDQTVRAGILKLLAGLQQTHGLTFVFISHDIHTVRRLCDRTAVMHLGRIVEIGDTTDVLERPQHPYTRKLLSAALSLTPGRAGSEFTSDDEQRGDRPLSGVGLERANSNKRNKITDTGGQL